MNGPLFPVPARLELSYDELRDRALAALAGGDHRSACRDFDWAYLRARELGDTDLVDRAFCNRAALVLEVGRGDSLAPELRRIAAESSDPEVRFLAAHHLSAILSSANRRAEAKVFAREACRAANRTGRGVWLGMSSYRLGLEFLKECRYSSARRHLDRAIEVLAAAPDREEDTALVSSSLAYCLSLEGLPAESRSALRQSAAFARFSSSKTYTTDLRLNFGFTWLNLEEYEATATLADRLLAEECLPIEYKHALYLAGAANATLGRRDAGEYYFRKLQAEFYSDQPMVVDLLLAHATEGLVNWLGP